jgi:hypothetical protein
MNTPHNAPAPASMALARPTQAANRPLQAQVAATAPAQSITAPAQSITAPAQSIEEMLRLQEGDSHPSTPVCRVAMYFICQEVEKLIDQFFGAPLDDLDDLAIAEAIEPLLSAMKRDYNPALNIRPRGEELRKIRLGIREYGAKKRRPTAEEIARIVDEAMGIDRTIPANVRKIVKAPSAGQSVGMLDPVTVEAAYKDVRMPRGYQVAIEDVPTHDANGQIIGEGRRKFLCYYHRMRGGLRPQLER